MAVMKRIWVSDRIKQLGKKKKDLAQSLGLPHTRISDIISGLRALKVTEVKPFADFMEMPIDEVIKRFSNKQHEEWSDYVMLVSDEKKVLEAYRELSEAGKEEIKAFVNDMKQDKN